MSTSSSIDDEGMDIMKPKLSLDEQIRYMRDEKGIQFVIVDETAAMEFLQYNNYYFKMKSYAKNFDKYQKGPNAGKYINLDFAYLIELSILDMHLRKYILSLTLDLEHFLKSQLLRDIADNNEEDGYKLVADFLEENSYVNKNIENKRGYSACADIVNKYSGQFAVWNIVEVISFGDFIKLYEKYYRKHGIDKRVLNGLWSVKFLRNAAAHNNCLLNSIVTPYSIKIKPNKDINTFIGKIPGMSGTSINNKMANPVIRDFIVTLFVYYNVVTSPKVKKHAMQDLKSLMEDRFTRHKDYFAKNDGLVSYYKFVKIIVDYFYDRCI